MREERQDGGGASTGSGLPKREYRRPELRELGPLTELTQFTSGGTPSADSEYGTS